MPTIVTYTTEDKSQMLIGVISFKLRGSSVFTFVDQNQYVTGPRNVLCTFLATQEAHFSTFFSCSDGRAPTPAYNSKKSALICITAQLKTNLCRRRPKVDAHVL